MNDRAASATDRLRDAIVSGMPRPNDVPVTVLIDIVESHIGFRADITDNDSALTELVRELSYVMTYGADDRGPSDPPWQDAIWPICAELVEEFSGAAV